MASLFLHGLSLSLSLLLQVDVVEAYQAQLRDIEQGQGLIKGLADLVANHSISYEQLQHACAIVS